MAKASAIISYIKRIFQSKKKSDNDSLNSFGVKWFDGEESDKPSEEETPLPMFYVGDEVQLYNPYEGVFLTLQDETLEPERHTIVAYDYDAEQKVFRYKLENGEEDDGGNTMWYSEDWLSLPTITTFTRVKETDTAKEELSMKMTELEGEILTKALDDELKGREIDRFLDMLREGNAEERKAAEKELRKLTGGMAE